MIDQKSHIKFMPLTPEIWNDFVTLFGDRGACGGCWCMWWRLQRKTYNEQKGEKNKQAMKNLVESGEIPGIIAFVDEKPAGWCSVAPRENYSALQRSRLLQPLDAQKVWSIVCFFIDKKYRNQGLSVKLLKAAVQFVKNQGGKIVEGYPVEPKKEKMPDLFAYYGLAAAFRKAGFVECARPSETRSIMRYFT
jgi:GNAT superfamily N-acetyltransferase